MDRQEESERKLGNIGYHFDIAQAGDVIYMLIRAAEASLKTPGEGQYVHTVLKAQADMIRQELHLREPSPDMMGDIEDFHEKFGLSYKGKPRALLGELFDFRLGFMREEVNEYEDEQEALKIALDRNDEQGIALRLEKQLDALIDEVYVVLGTAYLQFGRRIFNEAWDRVHRANMQKIRAETKDDSKRGSTFDVVKPQGWKAPNHLDLVEDHAHITYRLRGSLNPGASSDTQAVPATELHTSSE